MPQVQRKDLPPALFQHLLDRVQERQIDAHQLELVRPPAKVVAGAPS